MKAYKMVRIRKDATLGPMFVGCEEVFPVGSWITAHTNYKRKLDKVYSKLGWLKFRPGFHFAELPYAPHIGIKDKDGVIKWMHDDTVWVECEVSDEIDYTLEARQNGLRHGRFNAKNACLDYVPENGFYYYTTNPNARIQWIIGGSMMITRILTDGECENILSCHGIKSIPHRNTQYIDRIRKVA